MAGKTVVIKVAGVSYSGKRLKKAGVVPVT